MAVLSAAGLGGGESTVIETGVACSRWDCGVSPVLEQPAAASVATSRAAVICPLVFICPSPYVVAGRLTAAAFGRSKTQATGRGWEFQAAPVSNWRGVSCGLEAGRRREG